LYYLQMGEVRLTSQLIWQGGDAGNSGPPVAAAMHRISKSESTQTAYLHLGTPSYTHNLDLAVVVLFIRARRHCAVAHEASRPTVLSIGPIPKSQDPRE
jgi:hypothetical protein